MGNIIEECLKALVDVVTGAQQETQDDYALAGPKK